MIAGRPSALWLGLIQAGLNVIAAFIVVSTGHELDTQTLALFAAFNALGAAVIAVLANVAVTGTFFGREHKE